MQGREEASFDLLTDTNAVRLVVSDLGDRLYRISTPSRARALPRPEIQRDRVLLHLVPSGENGPGAVDVELNSRVRWRLRLANGAAAVVLDGERRSGLARGAVLTSAGWAGADERFDIDLVAGVATLTVRRR